MCGRYASARSAEELTAAFDADDLLTERLVARWNVAPTTQVPMVSTVRGGRVLRLARWGLIPRWAQNAAVGARQFNARAETVAVKPAFRTAFVGSRCLVPADGWFEWVPRVPGDRRAGRRPVYITPADGSLLAFAGLWDTWRSPSGPLISTTIITTAAVGQLREVHDRMPVVLRPEAWATWLAEGSGSGRCEPASLLAPPADEWISTLEVRSIGPAVGNTHNDGPEIVRPTTSIDFVQPTLL